MRLYIFSFLFFWFLRSCSPPPPSFLATSAYAESTIYRCLSYTIYISPPPSVTSATASMLSLTRRVTLFSWSSRFNVYYFVATIHELDLASAMCSALYLSPVVSSMRLGATYKSLLPSSVFIAVYVEFFVFLCSNIVYIACGY